MNSGSIMSVAFSWQVLLWDIGPNTVPAGGEGMKALPYQSTIASPMSGKLESGRVFAGLREDIHRYGEKAVFEIPGIQRGSRPGTERRMIVCSIMSDPTY